jgi:hypothetical protein
LPDQVSRQQQQQQEQQQKKQYEADSFTGIFAHGS